jgi:hypothetical protein
MAIATVSEDNNTIPPLSTLSLEEQWVHVDLITCTQCLDHIPEHVEEMLTCLFKATGKPDKDFIYKKIVKIINKTCIDDEQKAKEIRRRVRPLINEHLTETAQHVCLDKKNKLALQSIADELSFLPELFLLDKETRTVSFYHLERFADFYGQVELKEYGRQATQSLEKHSSAMIRGQNLYTLDQEKRTIEICLQIEHFYSTIYIGICSDNVAPNDIEQASNAFPIDPSLTSREGDIFHLLINVEEYSIYLWNSYQPKKYQNKEPKKRHRAISRRRCPLPWRFFVKLTDRSNHVRIVY